MEEILKQINAKLVEHDREFVALNNKLIEHDNKFASVDKRFDDIDRRFDAVDKRFDKAESSIDLLAIQMLKHEDRLDRIEENMATKADIREITGTLDKIVKLVEKRGQELTVTQDWMERTDKRVDTLESDVKQMKPLLGAA